MRIVTRGDLDGLTSSVLLSEVEKVDEIALVHPQDITDSRFEVVSGDILANLPYNPQCVLWFDHHKYTIMPEDGNFKGKHELESSAARVVFDFYHSPKLEKYQLLVEETDRFDSANLTTQDVLDPQGEILLGFLIDPRTGMGRGFKDFFKHLVKRLRVKSVGELLEDADMVLRASRFRNSTSKFQEFLLANSEVRDKTVITDYRNADTVPIGNRFLVYTTHPATNVSMRIQWGPEKAFVVVNLGHNIFNRTCKVDVGKICRSHGGGGQFRTGACILDPSTAEKKISKIIDQISNKDGYETF